MGERIYFATSNWKDKPDKPSCYSQGEWDARNSSKFNGVPFSSRFALEDINSLEVKIPDQAQFETYKTAIQKINTPSCPFIGWQLLEEVYKLPTVDEVSITLSCEDIEMKVWDGSTYYDLSGASKTWTWETCYSKMDRSLSAGYGDFKAPSARSDVYIPVCGPGTHITEITREEMMKIVWKISQFDLEASGFSAKVDSEKNLAQSTCFDYSNNPEGESVKSGPFDLKSSATVGTQNKNLDSQSAPTGKESNILTLEWDASPKRGYTGADGASAEIFGGSYYQDGPAGTGNGNVTVSSSISPTEYKCSSGALHISTDGSIDVTMKPCTNRSRFIYFVKDSTGLEKIYFDPTGLFYFSITAGGKAWGLDPANVLAPHTLTLNFLGKNYTLNVAGPENGLQPTEALVQEPTYHTVNFSSGTITISPKKYYPYANSKGEDVYDQDTGAQLKDPLS